MSSNGYDGSGFFPRLIWNSFVGISVGLGALAGTAAYLKYSKQFPRQSPVLKSKPSIIQEIFTNELEAEKSREALYDLVPEIRPKYDVSRISISANDPDVIDFATNRLVPLKLDQLFSSPTILIKDFDRVRELVSEFATDGADKLQILVDFDYILTRFARNGETCDTSYHAIEKSRRMPIDFRIEAARLRTKYFPLYQTRNTLDEKRESAMQDWLLQFIELMVQHRVHERDLVQAVRDTNSVLLRYKVPLCLKSMSSRHVPVTIFSASFALFIRELLRTQQCLSANMTVIANEFVSDSEGTIGGAREPIIHGLNKAVAVALNADILARTSDRKNVIMITDSIHDVSIVEKIPSMKNVLKIGFMVRTLEGAITQFKEKFDIVVIDQESFAVVSDIVEFIVQKK